MSLSGSQEGIPGISLRERQARKCVLEQESESDIVEGILHDGTEEQTLVS